MQRAPRYIELGRKKANNQLPLIFQPPILLWPLLACQPIEQNYDAVIEEIARWSRLEKMKGFYWNLASRGTGQGTIGDLRVTARVRNFPFVVGSTNS